MIEMLEQRTFLSATAAPASAAGLYAPEAAVRADITALSRQMSSSFTAIESDLLRLRIARLDRTSIAAYRKDSAAGPARLSAAAVRDFARMNLDAIFLSLASARAARFPDNGAFGNAVATYRAKLTAAATAAQAAIVADTSSLVTTITNDLQAIASKAPNDSKTQSDIATAETDLSSKAQQANASASTVSADASGIATAA